MKASARAATYDEIKPLLEICKAGQLFAVQDWIKSGKPINGPPPPKKGARKRSALQVAIDCGFHSLVQVLLEAGAEIKDSYRYCAMHHALRQRRFDLVKLLVEHGSDPADVDMTAVFDTWDPEIMEYFIERGADLETGNPVAYAFCNRIRTAMGVFKKHRQRFPSFQEQANIALRYHCKEGNLKWVSLMLWVGAEPYAPGVCSYEEEKDPDDEGTSALEYAALYEHFDIFKLKQLRLDPSQPALHSVLRHASEKGPEVFKKLIDAGINPNDQENGGSSAIQSLIWSLGWVFSLSIYERTPQKNIDTNESRERMKAIHLLAKHGARWVPGDASDIKSARRSLLKLTPDYTAEFVWIMAKYQACSPEAIDDLLRMPSIRGHISGHSQRIAELVVSMKGKGTN